MDAQVAVNHPPLVYAVRFRVPARRMATPNGVAFSFDGVVVDDEKKLISIFADGRVWIAVDVIHKLLASENLIGEPGDRVLAALYETVRYIEQQTVISISDSMLDSIDEQ